MVRLLLPTELLLLTEEPVLRVETPDDELPETVRELLTPEAELRVPVLRDTVELSELLRVIGTLRALSLLPVKEVDSRELLLPVAGLEARDALVPRDTLGVSLLLRLVAVRLLFTLELSRLLEVLLTVAPELPLFRRASLALAERNSVLTRPLWVFTAKSRLLGRPSFCGM